MKVFDGLYAYIWRNYMENNCNTYVIWGDVPTMIDPGHAHLFEHVVKGMKKDGIPIDEIKCVLCTHSHPDHMEAVGRFNQQKVKFGLSRLEAEYFEKVGPAFYQAFGGKMPELKPDFYLGEGELFLGEHRLEVINTPGHTPGEICLYWPEKRALFTGDVIFAQSVGRTDFPGGSGEQLKKSIQKLAALNTKYFLPGHMDIIIGKREVMLNFKIVMDSYFHML